MLGGRDINVLLSQVVVEKAPKSSIQDIDKRKFLVPSDLTGKKMEETALCSDSFYS